MSQLLQSPPKCLKILIAIKDISGEMLDRAKKLGISIKYFEEVEKMGAASRLPELVGFCGRQSVPCSLNCWERQEFYFDDLNLRHKYSKWESQRVDIFPFPSATQA